MKNVVVPALREEVRVFRFKKNAYTEPVAVPQKTENVNVISMRREGLARRATFYSI